MLTKHFISLQICNFSRHFFPRVIFVFQNTKDTADTCEENLKIYQSAVILVLLEIERSNQLYTMCVV